VLGWGLFSVGYNSSDDKQRESSRESYRMVALTEERGRVGFVKKEEGSREKQKG